VVPVAQQLAELVVQPDSTVLYAVWESVESVRRRDDWQRRLRRFSSKEALSALLAGPILLNALVPEPLAMIRSSWSTLE
jgi:hypothetical protein